MTTVVNEFFYRLGRHSNETATAFAARYKIQSARMEKFIEAEMYREQLSEYEIAVKKHRELIWQYHVDMTSYEKEKKHVEDQHGALQAILTRLQNTLAADRAEDYDEKS